MVAVRHVANVSAFAVRETTHAGPPKLRLLKRVRHALRARHGRRRTDKASVATSLWVEEVRR